MTKEFHAAVWLGIQTFDTCIARAYKIEDIIAHGETLEEVKENLASEQTNIKDDITNRRFAIIKVTHIEDVDMKVLTDESV